MNDLHCPQHSSNDAIWCHTCQSLRIHGEASGAVWTDVLGRVWSAEDTATRNAVCEALYVSGGAAPLPDLLWYGVRWLADGFGDLTCLPACIAQECIGDWSHVRDSSPEAFRAMHAYLVTHGVIA